MSWPLARRALGTRPQQQQRAGSRARPGPSRGEYGARGYGCRGFPGGFRRRCRRRWSGTTWPEGPDQRRTHYSAAATGGTAAPGSRAALAAAAAAAGRARPGASRCRSSRGRSSRSSTSAITRAPRATAVGSERVRRQLLGTPCSSLRCSPGSGPKERRRGARGSGVPGAVGKVGAAGRLGTRGDEGPRRAPASTVRDGRQGASARASAAGRNGAATCCQRFWCTCVSHCQAALSKELCRFRRPLRCFFLCTCVSIVCVCTCIISGCCRQLWRGCRLLLLPRRRAMKARSAQSQGSAVLRAACSKDLEQP